jgi:hypothetical protein
LKCRRILYVLESKYDLKCPWKLGKLNRNEIDQRDANEAGGTSCMPVALPVGRTAAPTLPAHWSPQTSSHRRPPFLPV